MEKTKQKQDIQNSEAKYRHLFNLMSEGVALHEIVYDKLKQPIDYKITEVNPAFEKITGIWMSR